MNKIQDDRIFLSTRLVAVAVVPFLVLAFIILYFTPGQTGQRFAWEIRPAMQSAYIGAGYLGGAWLFVNAIFGRRWHRVAPGFLPVTAFTISMLLLTLIHWDVFELSHGPFLLWLALYIVTPVLIPLIWWRNRVTDDGRPEPDDLVVPAVARHTMRFLGAGLLLFALAGFIFPGLVIAIWTWPLTPLLARAISGWASLLGVGGLVIGRESRWSAWRVGLQSIALWHVLVLIAAVVHRADFPGGPLNWYTLSVAVMLLGMLALTLKMRSTRQSIKTAH